MDKVNMDNLLAYARENKCSDIHLGVGFPVVFRRNGSLEYSNFKMTDEENEELIRSLLNEEQDRILDSGNDLDFSFGNDGFRQRVNVYRQQGKLCAAIRILNNNIPTLEELGLPQVVMKFAQEPGGLVLVTGPTGSGKSTTLAAIIERVNQTRSAHIITIEDPIEYIYKSDKCVIHQREIGSDVSTFSSALRSAMREDPDVILVGEMRDYETISAAITAAETGHLVLSTLHTTGAAQTIDRIIDVFPPHSQSQIRTQLSSVLRGIVTQTLVKKADGSGRVAATEILVGTPAILNLIRENKCHQIPSMLQSGGNVGMTTLTGNLASLVRKQIITPEVAIEAAGSAEDIQQYL